MKDTTTKRLGIFVIYDKDGIVDDYVCYLLKSLEPWLSDLIIVCNGIILTEEYQKLYKFTRHILIRENVGYDITAWQTAMFKFVGNKKASEYEEIILFNDSFYGPIYPWENVFQKMNPLKVDFWGLTKHPETIECVRGKIPEHIQCYFMAIRRKLFTSDAFAAYWNGLDLTDKGFLDAILQHELKFTSYFAELGYQWQVYVNAPALEAMQPEKNYNHYYLSPLEIVRDYQCPIVKKKALYEKNLSYVLGEESLELIQYIEKYTEYPIELILENLIRLIPSKILYVAFHMHYILKPHKVIEKKKKRKFLLYITGQSIWTNLGNLSSLHGDDGFEIDMVWVDKDIRLTDQKEYCKYDLIGKIKLQEGTIPLLCLHHNEIILENMAASEAYLEQVSELFDHNPYLGIVYPFKIGENMDLKETDSTWKSFWCRPEYFQFPEKYLFGTICSEDYATLTLQSCDHVLKTMQTRETLPDIFNKKDAFCSVELENFIDNHKKIFIFGTGIYGRRMYDFLKKKRRKPEAFVVSDGQRQMDIMGINVLALSKFAEQFGSLSECGMVVALSKKVQQEVIPNIKNGHIKNVFFI